MKENAYFTVEAALVLPLVISAFLMTVFLFVFQYDRCLLEQDMNLLAVYTGSVPAEDEDELREAAQRKVSEISMDKYAAWNMSEMRVTVEGTDVHTRGGGSLTFPLPGWNFYNEENVWSAEIHRETRRTSPQDFVRLFRMIKGGE